MKLLKFSLLAGGGAALLAVLAAAAFFALFDPNQFKSDVERLVKERWQRSLRLEGEVKIAFFPTLGVSLGKATLSEKDPGKEFASLESAHVSVQILPLLSGRVVVDEMRIVGLRVTVVKGKDGRLNVADLFETPDAGSADGPDFDLAGVRVERSALVYRDQGAAREFALSGLALSTGRIAKDAQGVLELSAALKAGRPVLDANFRMSAGYRIEPTTGAIAISGIDARLDGRLADFSALEATLKGDFAAVPRQEAFSASDLALAAKGKTGKEQVEIKLSLPKIAIVAGKASGANAGAELRVKGEQSSAEAVLKLAGIEASAKTASVASLVLDLTLVNPALAQKTLTLPIRGTLRADPAKPRVDADLTAQLDESKLQARLAVIDFEPFATTFEIDIDRLNVDRYLPPRAESAGPAPQDPAVDLSALKSLRTSGRLAIGSLTLYGAKLTSVKAEVRAANGRLEVGPHSASLYEGALRGTLSAEANGNRIVVKQDLTNVSIGPLLRDLTGRDVLEGRGNVAIDLAAAGQTQGALKKALSGSARVQLKDGAIKGINMAETLRRAKAVMGSKSAQQQAAKGGEQTDFSELSASFAVKNGVAHNEDLQAKAPLFRLAGSGDIDIGHSRLNYVARASVVASSQGQGGADLSHVRGLTIPVKLSGPFEAPQYEIDFAAVIAGAATERVRQTVEDKVKEAIGGRLKGLFGR